MSHGWVYVLTNASMPGLVKIGRTTRQPSERAAELSMPTGVATPFTLAFQQEFSNCVSAEAAIHGLLERRQTRVASRREFFRAAPAEVVRLLLDLAAQDREGAAPAPSPDALLQEGDKHLQGVGESLQDLAEAIRFYRMAASYGSCVALERMGAIFAGCRGQSRAGRRRAMQFLKDGARKGNYYCYIEMAQIFLEESDRTNFVKAWSLFFNLRRTALLEEAEFGEHRYGRALRRYLQHCLAFDIIPSHREELRANAESILHEAVTALDDVRDAPELRQSLDGVLQWIYQNLLPSAATPEPGSKTWRWGGWLLRRRPRLLAKAGVLF